MSGAELIAGIPIGDWQWIMCVYTFVGAVMLALRQGRGDLSGGSVAAIVVWPIIAVGSFLLWVIVVYVHLAGRRR